jgi:hypothetical protein
MLHRRQQFHKGIGGAIGQQHALDSPEGAGKQRGAAAATAAQEVRQAGRIPMWILNSRRTHAAS